MRFGHELRSEFLLDPEITYLNHGSFGATSRRVLAAQRTWIERAEREPVRFMVHRLPGLLREAAAELARFVGAPPDETAFVTNATTGVNAVLRSFPLRAGDRVVTTTHVYPAVRNALRFVVERAGAELVEVPLTLPVSGPLEVVARIEAELDRGAALALIDHVSSASALVLPIERLVLSCRERGIPVLVDGAHAIGMLPLDLAALGADWYTGNAHKWLCASKGCALIHARADRWPALLPTVISHATAGTDAFDWPGTRDFSPWLSVTEALAFYRELGGVQVRERNRALAIAAGAQLAAAWGTETAGPDEMTGSMRAIRLPGQRSATEDAAMALNRHLWERHRIEVPVLPIQGALWIRISAQVYNETADYERLEQAISGV